MDDKLFSFGLRKVIVLKVVIRWGTCSFRCKNYYGKIPSSFFFLLRRKKVENIVKNCLVRVYSYYMEFIESNSCCSSREIIIIFIWESLLFLLWIKRGLFLEYFFNFNWWRSAASRHEDFSNNDNEFELTSSISREC